MGNFDHVVVSISIDPPVNSKTDAPFSCEAYDYSLGDWGDLHDHLIEVPWEDIFKLSASVKFSEWVQSEIGVYIPYLSIRSKITHLHGFQLLVLLS